MPSGQHPEIWSCEKVASAFKLLEATTSSDLPEINGTMDLRAIGKSLLEKVKCIGNLLELEEQSASVSDFNELVFGTSPPPVPSQKELIYWYGMSFSLLTIIVLYYVCGYWYCGGQVWEFRTVSIWKHGLLPSSHCLR